MRSILFIVLLGVAHASFAAETDPPQAASPPAAEADSSDGSFVSGTLGSARILGGDGGTYFAYGFRAGLKVLGGRSGVLDVGLSLMSSSKESSVSNIQVSETVTAVMGEILGRRLFGSGLFVGARAGVGIVTVRLARNNSEISSGDDIDFAIGPVSGYEFRLSDNVSIPLEVSFLSISEGTTSNKIDFNAVSAVLLQTGLVIHW